MLFLRTPFTVAQFADFQGRTRMGVHSIVADPGFLDAERLDFRPSATSPIRTITGDGIPAGSRQRLKE